MHRLCAMRPLNHHGLTTAANFGITVSANRRRPIALDHRQELDGRRPHDQVCAGDEGATLVSTATEVTERAAEVAMLSVARRRNHDPALLGQTVIVIGGSGGIGLETARRGRVERRLHPHRAQFSKPRRNGTRHRDTHRGNRQATRPAVGKQARMDL